ncbi:MAG: DASS family sodium-coupled anion symporter [Chloroflexi bacterium]|nr:DASS family sodium-coupled anion symporter [Chloroflexota bacterium]
MSSTMWKIAIPLILWAVLVVYPLIFGVPTGLQIHAWWYFAAFVAVIVGLILEPIPAAAIGLIGVAFIATMRYVNANIGTSVNWALAGFADTTVWLIFGAFVFSMGYNKTGLGRRVALLLVRTLGGRTLGLGYAIALADLVLSPGTPSNTARSGGTVFPVIRNIPALYGSEPNSPTARKIGSYIMWTALAATCVTSSMFITSLAPTAAALAIVKTTTKLDVNWLQYAMGFLPVGIVLFLLVPIITYFIYPPEVKTSKEIPTWAAQELDKMGKITTKEIIMIGLVVLAIFLWITGSNAMVSLPYFGSNFINATTVVLLGIALMLVTGIVTWDEILANKGAWNVLVWFATLVTLANGLNTVGFVKWFADLASAPLKGLDPIMVMVLLVALFFFIHYFFASLSAHTSAVLPLVLGVGMKLLPAAMIAPFALLCVYALGLMGIISPYATGPSPVYYGSGYISRIDFWKLGLIFGLIFLAGLLIIGVPYLLNVKL